MKIKCFSLGLSFRRQMMNLKDDVYSFGFILLEALVAPSVSTRKGPSILKEMVGHKVSDYCFICIMHSMVGG